MDWFAAGHYMAQDTMDLFNTGYSVYQDQRNFNFSKKVFDYQKALQQQIFDREDTAVQRRRVDLEAAGLNPNLAAGSAAGAGAVVGTSGQAGDHNISKANLLQNYGAYLDAKKASEEVKQAEYMTNFLRDKSENLLNDQANAKAFEKIQQLYNSGVSPENYWIVNTSDKDDRPVLEIVKATWPGGITYPGGYWDNDRSFGITGNGKIYTVSPLADSKYWKSLENGWTMDLNDLQTSIYDLNMLKREEEWQTSDKWIDRSVKLFNLLFGSGNAAANMIRAVRPRANRPQVKSINKTWSRNSSSTTYGY